MRKCGVDARIGPQPFKHAKDRLDILKRPMPVGHDSTMRPECKYGGSAFITTRRVLARRDYQLGNVMSHPAAECVRALFKPQFPDQHVAQ